MLVFLSAPVAVRGQNNKPTKDLEGEAEYTYVLTMEKFKKLEEVRKAVGEWSDRNEQATERLQKDKSLAEGTLTEQVRVLNIKYPEFTAIIRKHGLSIWEYLLGSRVEIHAILLLDARTQGETKDFAKNVNPANLAFVEQNREEILKNIRFKM